MLVKAIAAGTLCDDRESLWRFTGKKKGLPLDSPPQYLFNFYYYLLFFLYENKLVGGFKQKLDGATSVFCGFF